MNFGKRVVGACLSCLALSFSMPAAADPATALAPVPGSFCPGTDTLLVSAEALSASLDLTLRSRSALMDHDSARALRELASVGTTLQLAASRGAAARTNQVIDAILQANVVEHYAKTLIWFPVLHASLLTLMNDPTVRAADHLIARAEGSMKGANDGDPITMLKAARHMLACDGLDIPLQAAIKAQGKLMEQFGRHTKKDDYEALLTSLRSALGYTLHSDVN